MSTDSLQSRHQDSEPTNAAEDVLYFDDHPVDFDAPPTTSTHFPNIPNIPEAPFTSTTTTTSSSSSTTTTTTNTATTSATYSPSKATKPYQPITMQSYAASHHITLPPPHKNFIWNPPKAQNENTFKTSKSTKTFVISNDSEWQCTYSLREKSISQVRKIYDLFVE